MVSRSCVASFNVNQKEIVEKITKKAHWKNEQIVNLTVLKLYLCTYYVGTYVRITNITYHKTNYFARVYLSANSSVG